MLRLGGGGWGVFLGFNSLSFFLYPYYCTYSGVFMLDYPYAA